MALTHQQQIAAAVAAAVKIETDKAAVLAGVTATKTTDALALAKVKLDDAVKLKASQDATAASKAAGIEATAARGRLSTAVKAAQATDAAAAVAKAKVVADTIRLNKEAEIRLAAANKAAAAKLAASNKLERTQAVSASYQAGISYQQAVTATGHTLSSTLGTDTKLTAATCPELNTTKAAGITKSAIKDPSKTPHKPTMNAKSLTIGDLTEGANSVGGKGVFDQVMAATMAHLQTQYAKNTLRGNELTAVYTGAITGVLQSSVAFLTHQFDAEVARDRLRAELARIGLEQDGLALGLEIQRHKTDADVDSINTNIILSTAKTKQEICASQNGVIVSRSKAEAEIDLLRARHITEHSQAVGQPNSLSVLGVQNALRAKQTETFDRHTELGVAKLFTDQYGIRKAQSDISSAAYAFHAGFGQGSIKDVLTATLAKVEGFKKADGSSSVSLNIGDRGHAGKND